MPRQSELKNKNQKQSEKENPEEKEKSKDQNETSTTVSGKSNSPVKTKSKSKSRSRSPRAKSKSKSKSKSRSKSRSINRVTRIDTAKNSANQHLVDYFHHLADTEKTGRSRSYRKWANKIAAIDIEITKGEDVGPIEMLGSKCIQNINEYLDRKTAYKYLPQNIKRKMPHPDSKSRSRSPSDSPGTISKFKSNSDRWKNMSPSDFKVNTTKRHALNPHPEDSELKWETRAGTPGFENHPNRELINIFNELRAFEFALGEEQKGIAYNRMMSELKKMTKRIESADDLEDKTGFGDSALTHVDEYLKTGKVSKLEVYHRDYGTPDDAKIATDIEAKREAEALNSEKKL